jgi:hypothetical protein
VNELKLLIDIIKNKFLKRIQIQIVNRMIFNQILLVFTFIILTCFDLSSVIYFFDYPCNAKIPSFTPHWICGLRFNHFIPIILANFNLSLVGHVTLSPILTLKTIQGVIEKINFTEINWKNITESKQFFL